MNRLSKLFVVLAAGLAGAVGVASAGWAYWTAQGTGSASASVGTLNPPTNVQASPTTGSAEVPITWTESGTTSPAGVTPAGYFVERRFAAGAWTAACGSSLSALTASADSCADTVTASGSYTYRATAVFASGSWTAVSGDSEPVVVTLDATPPTTGSSLAPPPNSAGWGNTTSLSMTLTATDNPGGTGVKNISYSATGAQPMATTVVGGASTSFEIAAEGLTTISFFATDNADNAETPQTVDVKIDRTAPAMPTIASTPALLTNATAATFTFTDADVDVVGFKCQLDSGSVADCNSGTVSYPGPISDGLHTFQVWAVDQADNQSASPASYSWTIDTTSGAPTGLTLTSGQDTGTSASDGITKINTPQFTGAAEPGSTIALFSGATQVGSGTTNASGAFTATASPALADGAYSITARATDLLGNISAPSAGKSISIDTLAPALTTLQMLDIDADGKVDRLMATFSESLEAPGGATAAWTLANVPSGGTLASVSVSGTVATLAINEGAGATNTAVGSFTVGLGTDAAGIRDAAGNLSSFAATAPADGASPVLVSATSTGGTVPGRMQAADTLTLVFSEALAAGSVPATTTVTEARSGQSTLTMASTIQSAIIDNDYLGGNNSSGTATGTITRPDSKTITITLGTVTTTGNGVGTGSKPVTVTPVATLTDVALNQAATASSVVARLF